MQQLIWCQCIATTMQRNAPNSSTWMNNIIFHGFEWMNEFNPETNQLKWLTILSDDMVEMQRRKHEIARATNKKPSNERQCARIK